MDRPPAAELQKQALWLFGVLVGLAIKEAITKVYGDVVGRGEFWGGLLEGARLFVFLMVILRFYLGAVQYFNAAYASQVAARDNVNRQFGTDFLFGFLHFTIFCFWGLSINLVDDNGWRLLFPVILGTILMYDVGWYLWSSTETRKNIRIWVVSNFVTACVGLLLFATTALALMFFANARSMHLSEQQSMACELVAYLPVLVASFIDLGGLLWGFTSIEEWLGEAIHRPRILGGHATTTNSPPEQGSEGASE